jgi:hypothetical protein
MRLILSLDFKFRGPTSEACADWTTDSRHSHVRRAADSANTWLSSLSLPLVHLILASSYAQIRIDVALRPVQRRGKASRVVGKLCLAFAGGISERQLSACSTWELLLRGDRDLGELLFAHRCEHDHMTVVRLKVFCSRFHVLFFRTRSCSKTCSLSRLPRTSSSTVRTMTILCGWMDILRMTSSSFFAFFFLCEHFSFPGRTRHLTHNPEDPLLLRSP